MKASELIYRLARAIDQEGDKEVRIAIDHGVITAIDNGEVVEASIKCVDALPEDGGDYFEIYGEVNP